MVFNAMIAHEHSANDPNGELAAAETQTQRLHPAGPSKPPGIKKRGYYIYVTEACNLRCD